MDKLTTLIEQIKSIPISTLIDIGIALIIVLVFGMFSGFFSYTIIKMFHIKVKDKKKLKKVPYYKPIKMFFTVLGIYLGLCVINIPIEAMLVITRLFKVIIIFLIANIIANIFSRDSDFVSKVQKKCKIDASDTKMNFVLKTVRVVVYIVAGLIAITALGFNINGIIAGFGVGGLILTLAAQDTAKNLFGGLVLMIDKPFAIGDWIEIKTFEGIVEDLTFRSTRIRTFDNSIVNIPNAVLSNEYIVNWSKMEKRRFKLNLKLPLDTPMEVVQRISSKIYFMLINHPSVINEDTYVKFDEIKDDGMNLKIYAFTNSIDYESYLNAKEQINKNIMEILEHEKN